MAWKLAFLALCLGGVSQAQKDLTTEGTLYSQEFSDNFSVLKHTGPFGPYSDRRSYGISRDPPNSCAVDQVILYHRHGARYPDEFIGHEVKKVLAKFKASNSSFTAGDLSFLDTWTYWAHDDCLLNQETTTGPYSGHADAFKRGAEYRHRYGHLLNANTTYPIFTSSYQRVLDTARKFGEGFFSEKYRTNAAINLLSQEPSAGANTLAPACQRPGAHSGISKIIELVTHAPKPIHDAASRLNSQYPGLNITDLDALTMFCMAALELNSRPTSPWINVFTSEEWATFIYALDRAYFYNAGAHDVNILRAIVAFDIIDFDKDLPRDPIKFDRSFQTADLVPMGGHLTIERLSCRNDANGPYVRMIINEAVVPIRDCQSGPGFSCPLSQFARRYSNMSSYSQECKIPAQYPQNFTAWWNYNTTSENNYQTTPVSCGSGKFKL
ncbi:hypothetical protein KEM56_002709, partial [Ascosphaera pollenicola]